MRLAAGHDVDDTVDSWREPGAPEMHEPDLVLLVTGRVLGALEREVDGNATPIALQMTVDTTAVFVGAGSGGRECPTTATGFEMSDDTSGSSELTLDAVEVFEMSRHFLHPRQVKCRPLSSHVHGNSPFFAPFGECLVRDEKNERVRQESGAPEGAPLSVCTAS